MSKKVEPNPDADVDASNEADAEVQAESEGAATSDSVESLRERCEDLEARWQRATADYANLKRRHAQDLEGHVRRRMVPLLEGLLLVVDNLDMALKSPTESQDAQNLAMGVQMTRDQLIRALETEEVNQIEAGETFDPERHQAMDTVKGTDSEPGSIVETVRPGYTWRDGVLRYAQVRVAAANEDEAETPAADTEE